MPTTSNSQRRKGNRKKGGRAIVRLEVRDGMGRARFITADVVDSSEHGIGVATVGELRPSTMVVIRGRIEDNGPEVEMRASVSWCAEGQTGFHAGLEFLDVAATNEPGEGRSHTETADSEEHDYYEIMQLSPNADSETIERVYRILAQRYHPDNLSTGDQGAFVRLCEAYHILNHPQERARYDAAYTQTKQLRWKIFDKFALSTGKEAEQRKRAGILSLLYAKMLNNPERASMTVLEMEELLGCPREHLQAALWYLRGKNFIRRGDNTKYEITVAGFEEAEGAKPASGAIRGQIAAPASGAAAHQTEIPVDPDLIALVRPR